MFSGSSCSQRRHWIVAVFRRTFSFHESVTPRCVKHVEQRFTIMFIDIESVGKRVHVFGDTHAQLNPLFYTSCTSTIEDDSAPGCPGASIHSVYRGISSLRRSAHLASSRNFCLTRRPYSRRSGTASFVSKLCSQSAPPYVQKSLQIQSRSCCARVCTPSVP